MQKDLTDATEALAEGLNEMHSNKTKTLINLVKKQAEEIDRRGEVAMRMQESVKLQKENIEKLLVHNKHLETMIETMKNERENLLEEIRILKAKTKTTRAKKIKEKKEDDTQAA